MVYDEAEAEPQEDCTGYEEHSVAAYSLWQLLGRSDLDR